MDFVFFMLMMLLATMSYTHWMWALASAFGGLLVGASKQRKLALTVFAVIIGVALIVAGTDGPVFKKDDFFLIVVGQSIALMIGYGLGAILRRLGKG